MPIVALIVNLLSYVGWLSWAVGWYQWPTTYGRGCM